MHICTEEIVGFWCSTNTINEFCRCVFTVEFGKRHGGNGLVGVINNSVNLRGGLDQVNAISNIADKILF